MKTPPATPETGTVHRAVQEVAEAFARQRHERQRRRHLERRDFDALAGAGFLRTCVPRDHGGLFDGAEASVRTVADQLRILAQGDSSVALVACMHPAVLYSGAWLTPFDLPEATAAAWEEQRSFIFGSSLDGHFWGTITSEPGSGGDISKTKSVARRTDEGGYLLYGQKHFGSGSGITSFMFTTAVPEGEEDPDVFYMDVRGASWDGTSGIELVAEWDGHGMTATQSHAMRFDGFPVVRTAYPGTFSREYTGNRGFIPCLFTSVIVGIVQVAMATARERLEARRGSLSAFESVEWTTARQEAWLVEQAFEGMLRSTEENGGRDALLGKTAIADLAESATTRLCRVMGGGSFSRHSPFGFWAQDVRALGFLRPPWALAYDDLLEQDELAEA